MRTAEELASNYVDVWNQTDAAQRRECVERLWVPDGKHFVRTLEARGYDALMQRITGSHEKNVRDAGYRFRASGPVQALQDMVMFQWDMVAATGGPVLALGLSVLQLAPDGRIAIDYQFMLPTP